MSFRVITAQLSGNHCDTAVLNGALFLSKLFDGHIDALFTRPDARALAATMTSDDMYSGVTETLLADIEQQWAKTASNAHNHFNNWCAHHHVHIGDGLDKRNAPTAELREVIGSERDVVGRKGRVCDIVVTPLPSLQSDSDNTGFESALLEAGRPILLMPTNSRNDMTIQKVLIAWNGSSEAFHAVSAAMPILKKASDVVVYTAPERDVSPEMAQNLASYLERHDVHALVHDARADHHKATGEALLSASAATGAGMLIMGAYTHSRFRELVLGGMTRHVLGHAHMPVLMAH